MVLSGGPLRANKELTGYGKETNRHQLHGERGWALIYKQLTEEQRRAFGCLYMVMGFYRFPFWGLRVVHATLGIGTREDYSCIRKG